MPVVALFVLWRIADFFIASLAPRYIPYLPSFSYPSAVQQLALPHFVKAFANFDGIFYLRIARDGYSQFEHAFFPLYPLFIRALSPIFGGSYFFAGLFISNASFLLGLFVFYKYLLLTNPKVKAQRAKSMPEPRLTRSKNQNPKTYLTFELWTLIFLLVFPTSFFFGALYSESLFFFFAISIFYLLQTKRYGLAGLTAFAAALTRLIGVFLFIPMLIYFYKKPPKLLPLAFAPIIALATYMTYLWKTTGDPLAFFSAHAAFDAGRSTSLVLLPQVYWRYAKIFATAQINFGYFIAILEITMFTAFLCLVIFGLVQGYKRRHIPFLALGIFSLINLLVPPLSGTFLSLPRIVLLSLSAFIVLGSIRQRYIKILIGTGFFILHGILLVYFVQGFFVS